LAAIIGRIRSIFQALAGILPLPIAIAGRYGSRVECSFDILHVFHPSPCRAMTARRNADEFLIVALHLHPPNRG
jgi:hypothetical protein